MLITGNIREWLRTENVSFREVRHEPTRTSEESARARGEQLRVGGKALLIKVDAEFRLFVLSADRKLDSAAIRARFSAKKTRFASPAELMDLTGLVPGSVPPFGPPILPFPLSVDPSVFENDRIAFNAGALTDSVIMPIEDYRRLANADVFSFSTPAEPSEAPRDYRVAIAALIRDQALPVDKYGHQPRLYALARNIAGTSPVDDDVLYAAAWLHDLGVFVGHRPEDPAALAAWDNVAYAMERVPAILAGVGFPAAKTDAVVEAIRTHQPQFQPSTSEGIILRDADILEQLGAMGILRTVAKVGRDTRFPTFTTAIDSLRRARATLPAQLKLESARILAEPRLAAMDQFLAAVAAEAGENLH